MTKVKRDDKVQFSQMIERRAIETGCTHIEAIVAYCEETGLEIEMVKLLINQQLKKKIEDEAKNLRLLPGRSAKLPL